MLASLLLGMNLTGRAVAPGNITGVAVAAGAIAPHVGACHCEKLFTVTGTNVGGIRSSPRSRQT